MKTSLILLVVAQVALALSAPQPQQRYKLPSFVSVCSRNENDLDACIKDRAQQALSGLAQGSKEFGFPPLDPLFVPEMRVDFERGPYKVFSAARDSTVRGIGKIQVQGARANITEEGGLSMDLDILIPRMTLEGNFKIGGNLAQIPIKGRGYYNSTIDDITATWHIETVPIKKDEETFLKVVRFPINYSFKDMKAYADNLIDGAPELSAFVMQAINQFWPFLIKESNAFTAEPFENFMKEAANRVFLSYPTSVLLP